MSFDKNIYYRDRMREYLRSCAINFEGKLKDIAESLKRTDVSKEQIEQTSKKIDGVRKALFALDDQIYTMFKKPKEKIEEQKEDISGKIDKAL